MLRCGTARGLSGSSLPTLPAERCVTVLFVRNLLSVRSSFTAMKQSAFILFASFCGSIVVPSLSAVPPPMGKYYDDTSEDVSGKLTFYPDYTLSIHVNLYGCAIPVSGVKHSKLTPVGKMTYEFTISYAGTDLANQINACKSDEIKIEDFDKPLSYTYRTIEPKRNSITTSWGPTKGVFFHGN